jgi:lipopolysaccharide heptosyltransferase II
VVLDAQKVEILMERFLVIQTAFIGDAILTLPMLQKLKQLNPESLIDVVSLPETAVIFHHSSVVNEVQILDKHGKHRSLSQVYKFARFIKLKKYSRIYSPHRSFRTSLIVMLSGVQETYGFNVNSLRHIYKYLAEYGDARHEVERNLRLLQYPVNGDAWKILPEINIPPQVSDKVDAFFSEIKEGKNFAAIAPGSIWNTKVYPIEYYGEIIEYLEKKMDYIFLVGGKKDKLICEDLENKFSENVKSVAGEFNIIESIYFLKRIKLLISNDSAPAHFGMCADIPVLMLYCSTVPDFGFYPYNKKSYFLSFNDLFCKPCGIHGFEKCPLNHFNCGYKLKPATVILKIKEMIND